MAASYPPAASPAAQGQGHQHQQEHQHEHEYQQQQQEYPSPPPLLLLPPPQQQQQNQQQQHYRQQRQQLQHARNSLSSIHTPPEHDCPYTEKEPCERHQNVHTERSCNNRRGHDSVISYPFSPVPSSTPSHNSSNTSSSSSSSVGQPGRQTPEIQPSPPAVHDRPVTYPQHAHLDPEKGPRDSSPQGRQSPNRESSLQKACVYDQREYDEGGPEEKAWQLLFHLSGPCALLSLTITLWTIAALIISLVLYPLRFCSTRPSLSSQLESFLAPALNLQLHLVYSNNPKTAYSPSLLVIIHIFSPIVAFGIAIAAWVAACFWFFSAILGDPGGPGGPDGHHNDGKESILSVRNWWEKWLARGLR